MTGAGLIFFILPLIVSHFVSLAFIIACRSRIKKMQDIIEKDDRVLNMLDFDRKDR